MTSRLLVADDSITIQKIVSMAFETEEVEVEGIGNGQEAFDRISEFNPDIVLADVDMPGLDGFELSAKIKESSGTSSIKVLLLASDFEDFDEQRYKSCGADDHISKPFKSGDIVAMVKSLLVPSSAGQETDLNSEDSPLEDKEPVDVEASEPSLEELLESVEKLSTDGMNNYDEEETEPTTDSEEDESVALTTEDFKEPEEVVEPVAVSEPEELPEEDLPSEELEPQTDQTIATKEEMFNSDNDLMDQMIRGVEDLKESVQSPKPSEEEDDFPFEFNDAESDLEELQEDREVEEASRYSDEPEIFAEVRQRNMDNMEDLDSTFKEIVMGGSPAQHEEVEGELSSLGGVVPEPEDLLERISPGTFSEVGKRPATPEDIKENLDYIPELSDQHQDREMASLHGDMRSDNWGNDSDLFTQAIADEVKRLLQRSLSSSLEKEVSGLSDAILKTIREVVREATPEIARELIREEIEKIKKEGKF